MIFDIHIYCEMITTLKLVNTASHPVPSTPLGHCRAQSRAPWALHQLPTSGPFHAWWCVRVSDSVSIHGLLSFPCCAHKSTLYVCVSVPALQIASPLPSSFFFRFQMYVLIYRISFSLSDVLHCVQRALATPTSVQMIQFCSFFMAE